MSMGIEARRVARDVIGDATVSTVFLDIEQIFETLVRGGLMDDEMDRYSTRDEAEKGHAQMCERVRAALLSETLV